MQPEQDSNTTPPIHTTEDTRLNPPQNLPMQPPSDLPQADYAGQTGLIAYLNTPRGRTVGVTVIVVFATLIAVAVVTLSGA